MPKKYLTAREAAEHLGHCPGWLYARWKRGEGPPRRKDGGVNLINIDALDRWAAEGKAKEPNA